MTQATIPLPPMRQTTTAPPPTNWSDPQSPLPVKTTKRTWKTWHLVAVAVVALLIGAAAGWWWWWWLTAGILPR